MTDTEIIIAETKRLMKENVEHSDGSTFYGGRASAFGELYSFMTSLPQEPASEDLDEAARNHAENSLTVKFPTTDIETLKMDVIHIFKSGARWMANKGESLDGATRIANERKRQIEKEGYDEEHDAKEPIDKFVACAISYAMYDIDEKEAKDWWTWDMKYFKPKDKVRNLERAGALIAAAIDKLLKEE